MICRWRGSPGGPGEGLLAPKVEQVPPCSGSIARPGTTPALRAFYQSLAAAGKAKKLAPTSAMGQVLVTVDAILRAAPTMAGTTTSSTNQDCR
jgi:hypothetical protein